jgi:hypothetical protein
MSCLNILDKIGIMLEQLSITKHMMQEDGIRPKQLERLKEEYDILKTDIRNMYFDLFKVIRN